MGTLIFLFVLFIALSVVAWHRGFDSTERISSCEWEHRQSWHGVERMPAGPHF